MEQPSLLNDYFQLIQKYKAKYGARTIVLMQVGAFFEMYGTQSLSEVCAICNLNVSDKKICIGSDPVMMAGFRDYTLDKYLAILSAAGYTTVVYVQEKKEGTNGSLPNPPFPERGVVGGRQPPTKIDRVFHAVYSPGTYLSFDTEPAQKSNNIMCVWFDVVKSFRSVSQTLVYGVSVANIATGKSHLFEYECPYYINPTTFDELERCVCVFEPCEIVFISPFDLGMTNKIIQFAGIKSGIPIHRVAMDAEKVVNCAKQQYIRHVIGTFFGVECYDICAEFNTMTTATQAFCYLMDFIQEHNPNLVRKISIPSFSNASHRMILANHTLKQLNIIDDNRDQHAGNLSSVLSFLNKCMTPMGRRLFHHQMTNPTFDAEWLSSEYAMIANMLDKYHFVELFRGQLPIVCDLEKIARQLVMRRLYPASIYQLYHSVRVISQIAVCLYEDKEILESIHITNGEIDDLCARMMKHIDDNLIVDACRSIRSVQTFEEQIIRAGVSPKLDDAIERQRIAHLVLEKIEEYFNSLLDTRGSIKRHETEKSGISLQITKKRATTIKSLIKSREPTVPLQPLPHESRGGGSPPAPLLFSLADVKFVNVSSNADEISFPLLDNTLHEINRLSQEIDALITLAYEGILMTMERDFLTTIETIAVYAARMDVMQAKAYCARTYNYCRPVISDTQTTGFAKATDLRHCLIEHIQTNETYVANDIHIGCDAQNGMLLYGTNAVGKTSLIRALGIAVIMAQSGMYVPCSTFVYRPYTAIYSRILGNDDLFKGLSTFAVEMSELRVILKMADANSLILGDEICSGTETESALSIFVAALANLHAKNSSFIFATHFHEIVRYDEIKTLTNMALYHMAVVFDRAADCLVYDRKLQPGSGNRMYGLEVCRSLYLDDEFLETAYQLRTKYFPENRGELSHTTAIYNAKKVRGMCEICRTELAAETHHIAQQKDASANGFIGTFHKNHPANLMGVCDKCHDQIHIPTQDPPAAVGSRKKTTRGFA